MTPTPEAHPDSVNGRFADYLATKKEAILAEWIHRVRHDAAIVPAESLNTLALEDHLPQLLDDLTNTLRRYHSEAVAGQAEKDAEAHGVTRLRQGYELPELLRELKHLRAVLIFHLRTFEDINSDDGMAARLFISTTLHEFLDEMAIDGVEEYIVAQLSQPDRLALEKTRC